MMTPASSQPEDDPIGSFARSTYTLLYRYAMSRTKDDALAQDEVQETYRKLLTALQGHPERQSEILRIEYAITVLLNTLRDHYRRSAREGKHFESSGRIGVARVGVDPGKTVSEDDDRTRFMSSLKRRQQQVLFLTEAGYTPAEIGKVLDIAEGTVRNLLTIIRRRWEAWESGN